MKTILKGTKLTVEMNKEEENIFFRKGLQLIIDRDFGGKVKVLTPSHYGSISENKKLQTVEASDEMVEECIKEAIIDAIKCFVAKRKEAQGEKQDDKSKRVKSMPRKVQGRIKTKRN